MIARAAALLIALSAALYFLVPAACLGDPFFQGALFLASIALPVCFRLLRRPAPPTGGNDNRFLWLGLGLLVCAPLWLALMAVVFTHLADQSESDFKTRLLAIPFEVTLGTGFAALGWRFLLWLGQ